MPRKKTATALSLGAFPVEPPAPVSDMPTLTLEEMRELEAQARAEVEVELKAKLKADFLAKSKQDIKKKALFAEGHSDLGNRIERITVDLPKFSDRITLDGVIYFHGGTYGFAGPKAAVIKEVMNRQWLHHAETKGLDMNDYMGRMPSNPVITQRSH
jgi:hypothetical protein